MVERGPGNVRSMGNASKRRVPDLQKCLPDDGIPLEDSLLALLYMRDKGEMLAPSVGVYGRAGEGRTATGLVSARNLSKETI